MTDQPQTTEVPEMTLNVFARLVANLYRKEADDHVITIGDWSMSPVHGGRPLFNGSIRLTVGQFRSWAPDHVREYAN